MNPVEYLDLEDVLEIIRVLNVGPIRDLGLLDSAINRPRASAFGEDAYLTFELKTAALFHSLAKNHSLVDGNKRTAWLCTVVFCELNGQRPNLSDNEAFELVLVVATTQIELGEIVNRLHLEAS